MSFKRTPFSKNISSSDSNIIRSYNEDKTKKFDWGIVTDLLPIIGGIAGTIIANNAANNNAQPQAAQPTIVIQNPNNQKDDSENKILGMDPVAAIFIGIAFIALIAFGMFYFSKK